MNVGVWISTAMGHPSNLRPFKSSFSTDEKFGLECIRRNNEGDPLPKDCFPAEIWGISSAEEKDYALPDVFRGAGFWMVSAATAEVLHQFDLGAGALHPVKVLKKDRATPVGDGWFCLNFGSRKSSFLPDRSTWFRHTYIRHGRKGWFPRLPFEDNAFSVSQAALPGPDIWIDPDVGDAFFLSDRLGKALKKSRVDKGFFLKTCRVV